MKKKINIRLVTIALFAVFATVLSVTIIYYGLFQKQVCSDLAVSAKLLQQTGYFNDTSINIRDIPLSNDLKELRITWVDQDGTVLYDNDVTPEILQNHLDRPEVAAAFANQTGQSIRRSDTLNQDTYYYAILLDNQTVLRVATDAQSLLSVFMSVIPMIGCIILAVIIVCVALSHLLTKQLLRPIEMMGENLDNSEYETPYKELEPFAKKIRNQHADILSAAKARQDFTANVSHELKTPLTAISGYAELLLTNEIEMTQSQHFYQKIKENADRLLSLINDIIKLSELDRANQMVPFEQLDLYQLVLECKDEILVNAKKREVELTVQGSPSIVVGNRDMLKEMIENLLQNAIIYNKANGQVMVLVEKNVLIVKDTGIGIPLSLQQRVFERFYRVDKSRSKATGGTGLGLAIVKHIVEIHDAKIQLESQENVGTTITVSF